MDNTTLVSLSNQLAMFRSMDVIANNLANISTPAYKREEAKFEEYVETAPPAEGQTGPQNVSFVKDAGIIRDLTEGRLERTDAPFDLAINGNGYFAVQTAAGERYTRNGHFALNAQGQIVTEDGDPVLGDGGAVTVTPDDGDITIAPDGTVSGASGQLAKLRIVNFANERGLRKQGASLYATGQTPTPVTDATIKQGMLEMSNVQPVIEISNMIDVTRAYQLTASLAQSADQLKREAIQKLGSAQG
jgi:flagellar basal-body rod protein FlgF